MAAGNNGTNKNLVGWQPGQSGNPAGRPKGTRELSHLVLAATDDGKELVDALVAIARGTLPEILSGEETKEVTVKDRLRAIEMLLDRGYGKPAGTLEVSGNVGLTVLDGLSLEQLEDRHRRLEALLETMVVDSTGVVIEDGG